jgi:hypothetical protein
VSVSSAGAATSREPYRCQPAAPRRLLRESPNVAAWQHSSSAHAAAARDRTTLPRGGFIVVSTPFLEKGTHPFLLSQP